MLYGLESINRFLVYTSKTAAAPSGRDQMKACKIASVSFVFLTRLLNIKSIAGIFFVCLLSDSDENILF